MQDTEIQERVETAGANVAAYERPAEAVPMTDGEDEDNHLGWSEDYDISVIPNDFNISTLCNFLDKGVIIIPEFQREFVWDKRKASRFIESVAVGLPVPELFFYQIERNKWWVVDGQQRLMTLYFFRKGRFPRPKEVVGIGRRMRGGDFLPEETWADNRKFSRFSLDLKSPDGVPGRLHDKSYDDLQDRIELKPLRTVVVRQFSPDGFNAAFEIFDRLNTGGVRLSPQQIRMCLFRSPLLEMVDDLNLSERWRALVDAPPMKDQGDAQMILRAFAMLSEEDNYKPGMAKFLNNFCRKMQKMEKSEIDVRVKFLRGLFEAFLRACEGAEEAFRPNGRFQISILEAVFVASFSGRFRQEKAPNGELSKLNAEAIFQMAEREDFEAASSQNSTTSANVRRRLEIAREILRPL